MPSALTMKLIGGLAGLLILVGLVLGLKHYKSLAESRGDGRPDEGSAGRHRSSLSEGSGARWKSRSYRDTSHRLFARW
jgi:hypothetical protein